MKESKRTEILVLTGLFLLTVVPIAAGIYRLFQLNRGLILPDNTRFFADPWPLILHVCSVSFYCVFGAFQFSPSLRRCFLSFHRILGHLTFFSGLMAALTGLWMTQFYPSANYDGATLYMVRLLVGSCMTAFLVLGLIFILRGEVRKHGIWMLRAYALGLGAGTQVLTHIPWFLFPSIRGEVARTLMMTLGWVFNVVAAELIIRNQSKKSISFILPTMPKRK